MGLQNYIILMTALVAIVAVQQIFANKCSKVGDCACGEQCVHGYDDTICRGKTCRGTCKRGCAVKDTFIPRGDSKHVYCNNCRCSHGPGNGIPACTRARWCNLPSGYPLYQDNPRCNTGGYN